MAKTTKPNVAKSTSAKAVKPPAKTEKKVEKKPEVKKVNVVKKKAAKPVKAKAPVKKTPIKPVAQKSAAKPAPKKTAPAKPLTKPVTKKVVATKPIAKPLAKKVVTTKSVAKPAAKKIVAVKPVVKPDAKKVVAVKPVAKPAVKKEVTAKPVMKTVVKNVTPVKPAGKAKKEPVPAVVKKTTIFENQEPPQDLSEVTIEKKLIALYSLQQIDSQVDKIRIIRGELPLEVQDLEDEIAGLETRIENYLQENSALEKSITEKKFSIKDSQALIKKYEEQQMNVRNNREYDSLTKEIEIQSLEIQLSEKRIREFQLAFDAKTEEINRFQSILTDRKNDLEIKKNELDDIVAETEKEENELIRNSEINRKFIEERLITAYTRIRKNARNGLAVVQIERDACGGCFNKIPPQHQLDIRMHKKIIVCEYCGRILVDDGIVNLVH
jgi:predicted  nucleic acid-binding Zn-ribbon protein